MTLSWKRTIHDAADVLGASITLANAQTINMAGCPTLDIEALIAQSDGTTAPTDTPLGAFEIWAADVDETAEYYRYFDADTQLEYINPAGDAVVKAVARIRALEKPFVRIPYTRTSGGGTNSVLTLRVKGLGIMDHYA